MSDRHDIETWATTLGGPLVRLAFVLTGDGDEAQDVVQTVFLRMMSGAPGSIENPQAYARRAVANEVASRHRRRAVLRAILPKLGASASESAPDSTAELADRDQLIQALHALSSKQRTVLVLRYFEDLDDQATGEIVGCSAATVRSIAARALAKLRANMSDEEG